MGSPKTPKVAPVPKPPVPAAGSAAADAEKKILGEKQGALSTWITRGQSLGGGTQLQ